MSCPRGEVEEEVLKRVRPSSEEREKAERIWRFVRERLEDVLKARGVNAEVTLQGSLAKDTWLSGDLDIDVFVLFPREWRDRLEGAKELFKEAFRGLPVEERYAAHPYIRVMVEDVWVDVVPALKVPRGSEAETAVDRTPFHTEYVRSRLSEEQKDEVRLLKQFLHGIGVYGAEIAVQGFSGYLAELLIIAFGCFRRVLEKASHWKPPIVIDIEGHYGGVVERLVERFRDNPLIVVDPVDPRRNVAAAVSTRSLAWFVAASRLYLRSPSIYYFWPPEPHLEPHYLLRMAGERAWRIVLAVYEMSGEAPDVAWGMVKAAARRMQSMLEERGVRVIDGEGVYCEDGGLGVVMLELEEYPGPRLRLHVGPDAWSGERLERFILKSVERGDVGPWVSSDARFYSLREKRIDLREAAVKAKPKRGVLRGVWLLGDAILEGVVDEGFCRGASRRVYEFIAKRPVWLEAVAGQLRSPQLQKAS